MLGLSQLHRYKDLLKHNQLSNEDVLLIIDEAIKLTNTRKRVVENYNEARKTLGHKQREIKQLQKELKEANKQIKWLKSKEES
jgi:predicted RNase H-like nuclease (RuvC/YqgF family)